MGFKSSIFKKVATLGRTGLEPAMEGRKNYQANLPDVEAEARRRAKICAACPLGLFVKEPISFLKVADERIPTLSGKMCDGCGCSSPYLLRQDLKICKQW